MYGEGQGFAQGVDAFSKNLFRALNFGVEKKYYDDADRRAVQKMEAQEAWRRSQTGESLPEDEKRFNRRLEIQRGKDGLGPSYEDESAEVDPDEEARALMQSHVMKSQDFGARQSFPLFRRRLR